MDPAVQEMGAEARNQLAKLAGRTIDVSDQQFHALTWPLGSSTYIAAQGSAPPNQNVDAWVTSERLAFPQPICTDSRLLDTSGLSTTGSDGKIVFRLRTFLCYRGADEFFEPVNLVATAQGASPTYMTLSHELIKDSSQTRFVDVEITASAWKPDGTVAANVRFYWRCRVPAAPVIP